MDFKKILGATAITLAATAALATPQYYGDTTADANLALDQGTGYYLWNDETNTSQWYLRWTAPGTDADIVNWFGDIEFENQNLGTVESFLFESSGLHADSFGTFSTNTSDFVDWTAVTNGSGGVDGINFTISGDFELMQLSLGSSLFSGLEVNATDPGVQSYGIYIGSEYESTNALVLESNTGIYQQFEIFVPEPATLALFGLGIAGLAASRRRNKNVAA